MFLIDLSFIYPGFDLTTISCIFFLLLLSLLSLTFIFHLRFKSKTHLHLQRFNSLWTVRFLLVSFISLWSINELFRIPSFRFRFLSSQSNLCKFHNLLSLGFLQPGFLITLLFLINQSTHNQKNKSSFFYYDNAIGAIGFFLIICLPNLLGQIFLIYYSPFKDELPWSFNRSYFVVKHDEYDKAVYCTYPLISTMWFGGFGFGYLLWFLFSCWKVVSLVINKSLRIRVYGLGFAVMAALPIQILFMGLSGFWRPDETQFSVVVLVVFLSTFSCAAAGEGILVIVPILDSLAAAAAEVVGDCRVGSIGPSRGKEREWEWERERVVEDM